MSRKPEPSSDGSIYRIPPYYYLHVLDQNANVTRVVEGPLTFIRQDNEKVVFGPEKMVTGLRSRAHMCMCVTIHSASTPLLHHREPRAARCRRGHRV